MSPGGYAREVEVKLARKQLRKSGLIDAKGMCLACEGRGELWRDGIARHVKPDVEEVKRAQVHSGRCPDAPPPPVSPDLERLQLRSGTWVICRHCRGHQLTETFLDRDGEKHRRTLGCGPSDDRVLAMTGRTKRKRRRLCSVSTEQALDAICAPSPLERSPAVPTPPADSLPQTLPPANPSTPPPSPASPQEDAA
jgi:hypothetical protein